MDADLFGATPVDLSLAILREYEPPEGYWGAFSGGKDSVVLKRLVELAGVRCDWHYQVTTLDPPPLMEFIRDQHPDVAWEKPHKSFYRLVKEGRGLPSRVARWCCQELKEVGGVGRLVLTGVRAAESKRRAGYGVVTPCLRMNKTLVAPILRWSTAQVWEFIRAEGLPYCRLYDEGWARLGCCLCPFSSAQDKARVFASWPRIPARILEACRVSWEEHPMHPARKLYQSPEEWFAWYVSGTRTDTEPEEQETFPFDQFDDEEEVSAV